MYSFLILTLAVLCIIGAFAISCIYVRYEAGQEAFCRSTGKKRASDTESIMATGMFLFGTINMPSWFVLTDAAIIANLKSGGNGTITAVLSIVVTLATMIILRLPFRRIILRRRREVRQLLGLEVADQSRAKNRSRLTIESATSGQSIQLARRS